MLMTTTTKDAEAAKTATADKAGEDTTNDTEATQETAPKKPRKPSAIMVQKAQNPDSEDPAAVRWIFGNRAFKTAADARKSVVELGEPGLFRIVSVRATFRVAVQQKPSVTLEDA